MFRKIYEVRSVKVNKMYSQFEIEISVNGKKTKWYGYGTQKRNWNTHGGGLQHYPERPRNPGRKELYLLATEYEKHLLKEVFGGNKKDS